MKPPLNCLKRKLPYNTKNRLKLQDTIEERQGLRGTHLNIPLSDLVEMNQTNFSPTDIYVTPVNETNIQVPTKTII